MGAGEAVCGPVEEKAPPASAATALQDRYKRLVVSMAVLGDERPAWRPSQYGSALWGCSLTFQYPIAKLLGYRARRSDLETNMNPFATVVLAHLTAQETRRTPASAWACHVCLDSPPL